MIQGGSRVVSCDCKNMDFFLNLCLVFNNIKPLNNILLHYSFCNYNSFIILENIMETPELFVHRWQTAPSPGAITMVNLKRTFSSGEWEKGVAIKDNVIIVEKVGIWQMCALLNIKLQQKRTKRKREK